MKNVVLQRAANGDTPLFSPPKLIGMPVERNSHRPILGIDADDTLWENEALFRAAEDQFCDLMSPWADRGLVNKALLDTDRVAIARYGYGVKGFVLSMIKTAIRLSNGAIPTMELAEIITLGDKILDAPVELLPGVQETLEKLAQEHYLLVITKGDITDQTTKVRNSGLAGLLWQIEVVGEKDEGTYRTILERYGIKPSAFIMVGNSVVSDILPVLALGGRAIHIPHHTTWELEIPKPEAVAGIEFPVLDSILKLPNLLSQWA